MKWNGLNRSPIRKRSKKLQSKLPGYNALVKELREGCGDRSELSGESGDWRFDYSVEPHHIEGRDGSRLTDPFNIIMLTTAEHEEQDSNGWERKQALLAYIKPIRIKQGYEQKPE
ncbi:hypothetical protein LCGC14_2209100 [marine sediment metagenome]|uniref:HNH endonuclease n=1 Tax=marine sediment metagenome TaxID=412755 RepID=A0A0F9DE94_9ZZZZ